MRDIHREAWFLNYLTSIPYYEACAQAAEDFADLFNRLLTGYGIHGEGRLDYWVSRYLNHAQEIRRRIEFVRHADYMPMLDQLDATRSDYRGLAEQNIYGWRTPAEERAWNATLNRMSSLCGTGSQALNNTWSAGEAWLDHLAGQEDTFVDRNDGFAKGATHTLEYWQNAGLIPIPESYPRYEPDLSTSCRTGEPCPKSGVWVPQQVLDEGLEHLQIEFAQAGRPMQPLYRFHLKEEVSPGVIESFRNMGWELEEEEMKAYAREEAISKAETAIWYPLVQVSETSNTPVQRGRVEAKQPCPRTGYWWTLAKDGSRRLFEKGEAMPDFPNSQYGGTIWYWDEDQAHQ